MSGDVLLREDCAEGVGGGEDAGGAGDGFVGACCVDDGAGGEVVALQDFGGEIIGYEVAVFVEVFAEVVAEQFLEYVDLCADGVVHVAFGFCYVGELVDVEFANLVVLEFFGIDRCFEGVENRVVDFKLRGGENRIVFGGKACGEVEVPTVADNVVDQSVALFGHNLDVGSDAATVAHFASGACVEHRCQRVGND